MNWFKKGILFFLSVILFTECTAFESKEEKGNNHKENIQNKPEKEELVEQFFHELRAWNDNHSIQELEKLGRAISDSDSTLSFYPYINEYGKNTFLFASNDTLNLDVFKKNEWLREDGEKDSYYQVWRKNINTYKLLEISIEPHPTLDWILAIRKRSQE